MAEYDFNIKQGADWSWELSGFENDISNDTFLMQIRAEKDKTSTLILDVSPFFTKTTDTLLCKVPFSETGLLDFSKSHYDLFHVDTQDNVVELLSGCVFMEKQITDIDSGEGQ